MWPSTQSLLRKRMERAIQNYAKSDIRIRYSGPVPFCVISLTCSKSFALGCNAGIRVFACFFSWLFWGYLKGIKFCGSLIL